MPDETDSGAGQLQDEIIRAIQHYASEGNMSIAEAVGVLEIVKAELLARLLEADD